MNKFERNKEKDEIIDEVLRSLTMALAVPDFSEVKGGVPVELAAEVLGQNPDYVKQGIKESWLPIGVYVRTTDREEYYISPKLFWEFTGYIFKQNQEGEKDDETEL